MVDIGDGRGKARSELGKENRKAILLFFQNNPGATRIACAKELSLCRETVARHIKAIRKG